MAFINIAFVLFLAVEISLITKRKITDMLPVAVFLIIMVLYIVSWCNMLKYMIPMLLTIGISMLFVALYKMKHTKIEVQTLVTDVVSPGLIIFLLLAGLLYYLSIDVQCFQWDEFSHWATTVKDMYFTDRLSIYQDSATYFRSYQPAMSLWQYFFAKSYDTWKDGVIIYAYNIYILLMMMPIFTKIKWRQVWIAPLLVSVVYCLPYWFYSAWEGNAWRCVYIDRALSFTLMYILISYFRTQQENRKLFDWISFGLAISILCLLKSTGVIFSIFAVITIILDILFIKSDTRSRDLRKIACCVGGSMLAYFSWNVRLRISHTEQVWKTNSITIKTIMNLITGKEEAWKYDVVHNFWTTICKTGLQTTSGIINIYIIAIPIVWIFALLFISLLTDKVIIKKRCRLFSIVFIVEFILYQVMILLTELYLFNPDEAQRLAGLVRYSSNFLLGISCFIILYLIDILLEEINMRRYKRNVLALVYAVAFVLCTVPVEQVNMDLFQHKKAVNAAYSAMGFNEYTRLEDDIAQIIKKDDAVYIVANNNLYGYYMLRKFFVPAITQEPGLAIWPDSYLDTWEDTVKNREIDYVYVLESTDAFNVKYNDLFENKKIENQTLYKVCKSNGLYFKKVKMN